MKIFMGLSKTAVLMLKIIGTLFLCFCGIGLLIIFVVYPFEQPLPFCVGLLAGCLLSAVKLILMHKSLARVMDMEGSKAKNYASLQAMLRYVGTIAVMLCAVFLPSVFGVFGLIIGILSLRITAYIANRMLEKHPEYIEDAIIEDALIENRD